MNQASISKKNYTPYLVIQSPEKNKTNFIIYKERTTIGRLKDINDISLEPDLQKLITRHMHCSIEYENNICWIIDNASKNGTFLKRDNSVNRINGKEKLTNNDIILVLGSINKNGDVVYWEIKYVDPQATEEVGKVFTNQSIEYDWVQAKLYIFKEKSKIEIKGLTPQEHKLIRFMQQKNINNGNTAVMCSYDEIFEAIWDELKDTKSKNDVNHLIACLRKKIEVNPDNPKYLLNIRGMGYRLITNSDII